MPEILTSLLRFSLLLNSPLSAIKYFSDFQGDVSGAKALATSLMTWVLSMGLAEPENWLLQIAYCECCPPEETSYLLWHWRLSSSLYLLPRAPIWACLRMRFQTHLVRSCLGENHAQRHLLGCKSRILTGVSTPSPRGPQRLLLSELLVQHQLPHRVPVPLFHLCGFSEPPKQACQKQGKEGVLWNKV